MVPVQGQLQGAAQGIRFGGSSGQGRCRVLLEDAAVRAVCALWSGCCCQSSLCALEQELCCFCRPLQGAAVKMLFALWSLARHYLLLSRVYAGVILLGVFSPLPFRFLASLLFAFLLSPASWLLCFSAVLLFRFSPLLFPAFLVFYIYIYMCVCMYVMYVCNVCMYVCVSVCLCMYVCYVT